MKISQVMTPCPYHISGTAGMEAAIEMMAIRNIRHLPVVEDGDLIGVVSDRDLRLSKFVCETTKYCPLLRDLCQQEPLIVLADQDVSEVAKSMAEVKADVALVSDESGNFVGIFTTNDACRLIHIILEEAKTDKCLTNLI